MQSKENSAPHESVKNVQSVGHSSPSNDRNCGQNSSKQKQTQGHQNQRNRQHNRQLNNSHNRSSALPQSLGPAIDRDFMARSFFSRKTALGVENCISNIAIHNLSSWRLFADERRLLGHKIKFIPHPPPMFVLDVHKEFRAFARLLCLRAFFGSEDPPVSCSPLVSRLFPHPFCEKNPFWFLEEQNIQLEEIIHKAEDTF